MSNVPTDRSAYHAAWYAKHREQILADQQQRYAANRAKKKQTVDAYRSNPLVKARLAAKQKEYNQRNKEKVSRNRRHHHLLKKYGLGLDGYAKLLANQKNQCALCNLLLPENPKRGEIHVDHCHRTGKVRGIVHRACNVVIGYAMENVQLLQKAVAYIERHNS